MCVRILTGPESRSIFEEARSLEVSTLVVMENKFSAKVFREFLGGGGRRFYTCVPVPQMKSREQKFW